MSKVINKTIKLPFTLFPWQKDIILGILKYPNDIHIAKSKRQVGKSVTCEVLLLYFAINKAGSTSICISPTLNQSRKIYKEILKGIQNLPVYQSSNSTILEINLTNGSCIKFKSGEQRDSLRGESVNGILILDEAVFVPDEVIFTTLPFVDVARAPILLTSTPKFRDGVFYEFYTKGENFEDGFHSYNINKYDTSALLSQERLEMYRKSCAPQIFLTEYLGEFCDYSSSVFGNVDKLIGSTISPSKEIVAGIDWGSGNGGDDTAITIMNDSKQIIKVFYFNDKDVMQTIDFIVSKLKEYGVKKCVCEVNSIGSTYLNLLKRRVSNENIKCQIIDFVTTNDSKREIIENLQVNCLNGSIQLINDKKLLLEMVSYQMEKTSTGRVTYNGSPGVNDDIVISISLALHALKSGRYNIR